MLPRSLGASQQKRALENWGSFASRSAAVTYSGATKVVIKPVAPQQTPRRRQAGRRPHFAFVVSIPWSIPFSHDTLSFFPSCPASCPTTPTVFSSSTSQPSLLRICRMRKLLTRNLSPVSSLPPLRPRRHRSRNEPLPPATPPIARSSCSVYRPARFSVC